ncbi:Hypothetical predicted protein [Marmota monax]|uniref:G-protein coupled receptors family 1 profile domain-containing protein n=1 Tax=Marmota monax TaxID=9995 RepID=A0A5E4D7B1_MARMO|nr:hypothetical protein GHT09_012888 [Marmota monax]VTJ90137.1 Hypothetical predicted protein [Marmota monax]
MAVQSNYSTVLISEFLLICFPNYQSWQHWLSLPLSLLFLLAMGANTTLLIIIWLEASLHEPMYYLLSLLSLLDIVLCLTVIPKVLAIFWFDLRSISFYACSLQMFIMNSFFTMESCNFITVLLVLVITNLARERIPPDVPIILNILHHLIPPALFMV